MANEIEWVYGSSIALETSGGTITNSGFNSGDGSSITTSGHGDWPLCDLEIYYAGHGTGALVGRQVVNVYRQAMDMVGGSNDAAAPSATNKTLYVGSFALWQSMASASTGYFHLPNVPLCNACIFWIENTTGQQMNSAWSLTARPKSYIPGA